MIRIRTTSLPENSGSGYLTIRAERHDKTEGKHRTEFRYGSFSRSLPLPGDANADDVKASYDHGILTVSVGLKVMSPVTRGANAASQARSTMYPLAIALRLSGQADVCSAVRRTGSRRQAG